MGKIIPFNTKVRHDRCLKSNHSSVRFGNNDGSNLFLWLDYSLEELTLLKEVLYFTPERDPENKKKEVTSLALNLQYTYINDLIMKINNGEQPITYRHPLLTHIIEIEYIKKALQSEIQHMDKRSLIIANNLIVYLNLREKKYKNELSYIEQLTDKKKFEVLLDERAMLCGS